MKILIVNHSDRIGGAAIAASRIHQSLLDCNIDSNMLVERIAGGVPKVFRLDNGMRYWGSRVMGRLEHWLIRMQKDESTFVNSINYRPNRLVERIQELDPDIVHLNWVGAGTLKIEDLKIINKPIVWTLHDMWPIRDQSTEFDLPSVGQFYSKDSRSTNARVLTCSPFGKGR